MKCRPASIAAAAARVRPLRWVPTVMFVVAQTILGPASVEAATPARVTSSVRVDVRVVNQNKAPLQPATAMACPYVAGLPDCDQLVAGPTDRRGVATLSLIKGVRYDITAFVLDPDPAWACPGFLYEGGEFYFAVNPFSAEAQKARGNTLVIHEPDANECVPVSVVDDFGTTLTTANMFVCPIAGDGTPCAEPTYPTRDAEGTLRLDVNPSVTYRLTPFIVNSGWPCPPFMSESGDTFHFGDTRDIDGAALIAGSTLVIHHPAAEECD